MPDIHWHVGEGAERETITKATPTRRSRVSWLAILIVVILGAGLGALYRSLPEPAPRPTPAPQPTLRPTLTYPAVPAKLYASIDREAQALADGDVETYLALHLLGDDTWVEQQRNMFYVWGRPSDDSPLFTILDSNLRTSTKAWADIRQFRNGRWFRETRFYQWEKDRWLRIDSDPFFWSGQTETLETTHFHAVYASEDRDLARPIVNQLEEIYPQLCRDLGCTEAAAGLVFTLKMNSTSPDGLLLLEDGRNLVFASPRLTGVFEDNLLESGNWLWGVMLATIQRAYYDAATQWNGDAPGRFVFNAIIARAVERVRNPQYNPQAFIRSLATQSFVPLEKLWGPAHEFDQKQQMWVPRTIPSIAQGETIAVVYFIEQEYGIQAMPKLLKALGTAQSFADMIETSLGVPFDEFDQKWQAWIKQNLEAPQ